MAYPYKRNAKTGIYRVYVHYVPQTAKRYIGMTGQKLEKRFQRGYGYEKNTEFFNDIEKYGWDSIQTEIIAETKDFELACHFENAAMQRFDTLNNEKGYNSWSSGYENKPIDKVGRNISKAKIGHSVSEETKEKLRKANNQAVVQLTLDGQFVECFESMTSAAKAMGIVKQGIWAVCKGVKPSAAGFKWMKVKDYLPLIVKFERIRRVA